MLNYLIENYKISYREFKNNNYLARECILNIGAAVSYRPVEFIPLVVSWIFITGEGRDYFKWSESEWFQPTIIEIINQAEKLVKPYEDEEINKPYEVLLKDYGLTIGEYWRTKVVNIKDFVEDFKLILYRFIIGAEGVFHQSYNPVYSGRPSWSIVLTIGGEAGETHDLTFGINLNQHAFFDPRVGEFKGKELFQVCEFVADYLFHAYPSYFKRFFMMVFDNPTEISNTFQILSNYDKQLNYKKPIAAV